MIAEIKNIEGRIEVETPPKGVLYYKYKADGKGDGDKIRDDDDQDVLDQAITNRKVMETSDKLKIKIRFSDLPISKSTLSGLFKAKYIKMTETQRASLPHSIAGRDIVCCARTGSGKTLSYLLPIIERLYRERWSDEDGLGALVLVPTRELGL